MRNRLILAAFLSGVLLSLAWLGVSGIVLVFALVPLLLVEDFFYKGRKQNTSFDILWFALLTFFLWNALTTWWIGYATIVGALVAIIVNSLLMSMIWWLFHSVHRSRGDGVGFIFLLVCWTSFEFFQFHWELSWPWLTLGNGLAKDIYLIQWYEFTGVFGGTWWLIILNVLISRLVKAYLIEGRSFRFFPVLLLVLIFLLPIGYSILRFHNYNEKPDVVKVVLLQPNIDPYFEKFGGMSYSSQYDRIFKLADSAGNTDVDFFIGPETAFHEVWLSSIEKDEAIIRTRKIIVEKYPNAAFILGAMTFKNYPSEKDATSTSRFSPDSSVIYDAFNSALFINNNRPIEIYHKAKLVSGVEKMPFENYLHFLRPLILNLGGTTGSLGESEDPVVFSKDSTVIGVPICYESIYGAYVANFVNRGANVLAVITNDGWWKNSPGYKQHLSFSQILAISHRRSIARSGNTGISCIINQKGEIEKQTQWWTETAMAGSLNRNRTITFYTKHGDYMAWISVVVLFVLMLNYSIEEIRKWKKKPH